jgi:hypothetical protein
MGCNLNSIANNTTLIFGCSASDFNAILSDGGNGIFLRVVRDAAGHLSGGVT